MYPLILQNTSAPFGFLKSPDIFCWIVIILRSLSAWLLLKGTLRSVANLKISFSYFSSLSRRFLASLCACIPLLTSSAFDISSGGLSSNPFISIEWYFSMNVLIVSSPILVPCFLAQSACSLISYKRSEISLAHSWLYVSYIFLSSLWIWTLHNACSHLYLK